jgi:hypothetical protein
MTKRVLLISIAILICGSFLGCGKGKVKERGTPEFYMKGVRLAWKRLDYEAMKEKDKRDNYGMQAAVMKVEEVLAGLPTMIDEKASGQKEERKEAAKAATEYFEKELRPLLLPLDYEASDARERLDKFSALVDKIDQP